MTNSSPLLKLGISCLAYNIYGGTKVQSDTSTVIFAIRSLTATGFLVIEDIKSRLVPHHPSI